MTNLAEPTVENLQKASDHFLHLTATAVGGSAVHLRDKHGIERGPAAIERARQHGEAHGVPNVPDAALPGTWPRSAPCGEGDQRAMTDTAGTVPEKVDRILWNTRGEDIDEIVISDVKMVHVEQMHDRSWWIGIYMPDGRRWSGNFTCDSRGRMGFSEQDCDIEWDDDASHDERQP